MLVCAALARATPVPKPRLAPKTVAPRSEEASALRDGRAIDPNLATAGDLDLLPGVGPSVAARIIEARVKGGPFRKPEDMLRVRGVGLKTLEKLKPFLRFDSQQIEHTGQPQLGLGGAEHVTGHGEHADAHVETGRPLARDQPIAADEKMAGGRDFKAVAAEQER